MSPPAPIRLLLLLLGCAVACAAITPTPARAGDPVAAAEIVDVGLNGQFKVGRWTPLRVRVRTTAPCSLALTIETPDPDGNVTVLRTDERAYRDPGEHDIAALFRPGRLDVPLAVTLTATTGEVRRELPVGGEATYAALEQSAFLVGVIGGPDDADRLAAAPLRMVRLQPGRLPDSARGYESLDAMLVFGGGGLGREAAAALLEWVRLGGHLLVSVGAGRAEYLASPLGAAISGGEGAPVAIAPDESIQLSDLRGLESYAERPDPLDVQRPFPVGVRFAPGAGKPLVTVLSGPLIVRAPYGLGRVTVFGADLDRPPLAEWPSLPIIVRKLLLGGGRSRGVPGDEGRGQLARTGITELATQIQAVQSEFPDVAKASSWTVLGLMVLYLVIIGPIDYLLVHRWLRRPQMTWVTFPAWVALAAALAAWGARAGNGDELRANQLDVLDVDAATGTVRAQSWLTLYSPRTQRYQVSARPADWSRDPSRGRSRGSSPSSNTVAASADGLAPRVSWSAVPENTFGGLYRRQGFRLGRPWYAYADDAQSIANYPVAVWSTGNLTASWSASGATALVESDLRDAGFSRLAGTVTHHLPAALEDWLIAYQRTVYRLEPDADTGRVAAWPPGRAWPPGGQWAAVSPRELAGFLTGAVRVEEIDRAGLPSYGTEHAPYDPLRPGNPDAAGEILRVLTFHGRAGGTDYTGLNNHALRPLDLTDLLALDRAVLFGRIKEPATEYDLGEETPATHRRTTFVRIVLPVRPLEPSE